MSERAGVKAENCLVFEDTNPGVESASSAGMKCVAVPNKFTQSQDFSNASLVVSDLGKDARIIQ